MRSPSSGELRPDLNSFCVSTNPILGKPRTFSLKEDTMSDLISKIKDIYAAFGRGDIATILASMTDDVSWEFEAPAELSWSGIRHSPQEAAGFFSGLASEQADPKLEMTEFFSTTDAVAAFGRYQATVKATGIRVDTPVAHYFKFRDGKIARYINVINSAAFVAANRATAAAAAGR
jgi:ketosteroid isomerase-like protein